jgi:hypothetical protein
VVWGRGAQTPEESRLGFKFDPEKGPFPDEENVLSIAEAWSVNPMKLGAMGLGPGLGFLGRLP